MNFLRSILNTIETNFKYLQPRQISIYVKNLVKTQVGSLDFKDITLWIKFVAYALPFSFFLYILYINYLPFGFERTYVINVGEPNDTTPSNFYLEPSPNLSERKVDENGNTYRILNGTAYATFKPDMVLKNATVTVSVAGEGVSLIPPIVNLSSNDYAWDYNWDFTKGVPEDLKGNAFLFDGEPTWNGIDTRLELPKSQDKFEDHPFSIYLKFKADSPLDYQQILGHFNWEIWQNRNSLEFRVGRMNNSSGPVHRLIFKISNNEYWNESHELLVSYSPSENNESNGFIEMYLDMRLVGRIYFGDQKIMKDYGKENLSIGWTPHNFGNNPYFKGQIYNIRIASSTKTRTVTQLEYSEEIINKHILNLIGSASNSLKSINFHVKSD